MSYKEGDKFIIEIKSRHYIPFEGTKYYINGFNTLVFDDNGLDRLENYDTDYNDGYENGLHYAWECAKIISKLNAEEIYTRFGLRSTAEVFDEFSASEVENKIIEYKIKQKAQQTEIKVGDEVMGAGNDKGIVTHILENKMYILWEDGSSGEFPIPPDLFKKTGRHFPIEDILEQMRGTDDES